MSKKHSDEILALAQEALLTDAGRSHAFSFLAGVLSARAEWGKPVSATTLVKAVLSAVESASKAPAEQRAREEEQAWRAAKEAELPEPREIPDLDPTHFSHAMTGVGKTTSWCGAPGPVAVFAFSVTCPVCRNMLTAEEEGDLGARTLAVPPLADDTSASDETAQEEIVEAAEVVTGRARYGDPELDGLACILCHKEFAVGEASAPAGIVDGGPQVFAHRICLGILHAPMPGNATRKTRCGRSLIETGALITPNPTAATCTECKELLAIEERHAAGVAQLRAEIRRPVFPDEVLLPISKSFAEQVEAVIEGWAPEVRAAVAAAVDADRTALPELAAAVVNGSTPRAEADAVIEEWVPKAVVPLPTPQRLWVHSGPCIYCSHGPACVTCDLTQGPYWGKGPAGHEYPGPVCSNCSAECKRMEIAADPYYSGDYTTMFGDDE